MTGDSLNTLIQKNSSMGSMLEELNTMQKRMNELIDQLNQLVTSSELILCTEELHRGKYTKKSDRFIKVRFKKDKLNAVIGELIKSENLQMCNISGMCGMSESGFLTARKGEELSLQSAKKIAEGLKIQLEEYLEDDT